MTEVVKSEGNETAKEEIVFSKLKTLSLVDLDSLTSFYSGDYTFKFPSSEDLFVIGCPKMDIFTTGELSTPTRVDVMYSQGGKEQRAMVILTQPYNNYTKKRYIYVLSEWIRNSCNDNYFTIIRLSIDN